jgi:hypothetical protein
MEVRASLAPSPSIALAESRPTIWGMSGGYNNSAAAKGIQFFSLFNLATNVKKAWADWTILPAAKITAGYLIDKASQAIGNTEFWSLTSGASAPADLVVAPTAAGVATAETVGKVAGVPTIVYATGLDALANAGCATVGRQAAGQMTPLPPGWTP